MSATGDEMELFAVEGSNLDNNDEKLTKSALSLQNKLDALRDKLMKARCQKASLTPSYDGKDFQFYKKVTSEELHKLTDERTRTFLNFNSVQAALRAAQTNQVLTKALRLKKNDEFQLEPEEEVYIKELLEEQRDLSQALLKNHEIGSQQEIQIIEARAELAGLLFKYHELRNESGPLLFREEEKDKNIQLLEKSIKEEDCKLNQMRFIIQKLMLGEEQFGMTFDSETNARFKRMLVRCGMKPEEFRKERMSED